jgi:hypothetical protein
MVATHRRLVVGATLKDLFSNVASGAKGDLFRQR